MSASHAISLAIQEHSRIIEVHSFLQKTASGQQDLSVWRHWGQQKYMASSSFVALLERAIHLCQQAGLSKTADALLDNVRDEKGLDRHGKPLRVGSHEDWRIVFYEALGISPDGLAPPHTQQTAAYLEHINGLIQAGDVWALLGTLLFLEYNIAKEMELIECGLDATPAFSDSFDKKTAEGRKSRLYVIHHAAHDLEQHFPELRDAIFEDIADNTVEGATDIMLNSIQDMQQVKLAFYDGCMT